MSEALDQVNVSERSKQVLALAYLYSRERLREIAVLIGQDKGRAASELAERLLIDSRAEQWARRQIELNIKESV